MIDGVRRGPPAAAAEDPFAALRALAAAPGPVIDIAETALACAALDRPGVELGPYRDHLAALAAAARDRAGTAPPPDALAGLLSGEHGYRGDSETYDDLANADLTRVIDRRRGLPVALSIVWMHAARAAGWRCVGLDMPAHFLLRLEGDGGSWVIDPFAGGRALDRAGFEARLRAAAARMPLREPGELDDRAVVLRLQNNIRVRLQQAGEAGRALDVLRRMLVLAPASAALWEEASGLHVAQGGLRAALECLDAAMALAPDMAARQRIAASRAIVASRLN
jgi:regulator of sirC expression with transglutaminase-like and TPR domain